MECKLVKAGYGTLDDVRKMSARDFLQALSYEKFLADYEIASIQLNRKSV